MTATKDRKHRVQTLLDTETHRGLKRLVRKASTTQSTWVYELIQKAIKAEERNGTK
jgi:hypothetical protein